MDHLNPAFCCSKAAQDGDGRRDRLEKVDEQDEQAIVSKEKRPSHAPASLECAAALKNVLLATSVHAGWTSCVLDHVEGDHFAEAHETHATPDLTVVVATRGEHDVDVLSYGRWRSATYQTGAVGLTRGGETTKLRWRNRRPLSPFRTAHLYVPQAFMEEAIELVRRPGQRPSADLSSILVVNEEVTASVVASLLAAMGRGETDMFAETALRWLSLHLVSRFGGGEHDRRCAVPGNALSDMRLARAVEYMTSDLARPLAVADIACEAGVSPFHFARLFSRRMGVSPHAFLTRCRMEKAQSLLITTDLPIAVVGVECGYLTPGSFSSTFLRHMGQTPGYARKTSRR